MGTLLVQHTVIGHLPMTSTWTSSLVSPLLQPPYPTPSLGSWPHILKGLGAMGTPVA